MEKDHDDEPEIAKTLQLLHDYMQQGKEELVEDNSPSFSAEKGKEKTETTNENNASAVTEPLAALRDILSLPPNEPGVKQ